MRKSGICAMALASMAAVALPVSADAKKPGKSYKEATFKATISGNQISTWEYHRAENPDDPCDTGADGNGDQQIAFDGPGTFKITFRTPPKGQPNLYGTKGRPFVFSAPFQVPIDATADRQGSLSTTGQIGPKCEDNGGADPGYVPTPPDCGTRNGGFSANFYFHDQSQDPDDLLVPLPGNSEKNRLTFGSENEDWLSPDGQEHSSELRDLYVNCPFYGDYPPDAGHIYLTGGKIKESRLFDKRVKKIVIAGDTTENETKDNTKTRTILAWNLRLRRVK